MYHGKRHTLTLGKAAQDEAESKANQVDYLLMRLGQNLLELPDGIDIVTVVSFDGKPPSQKTEAGCLTLAALQRDTWKPTVRAWVNPP